MVTLVVGCGNLLIGAAYVWLGLLSAWEAASQYQTRGLSRFGVGFSLMAASCGPHHLVHGWCALHGGAVSTPMLAATLVGLPGGAIFCALRVEAMMQGRGDRAVAISARELSIGAACLLVFVGALAAWSIAQAPVAGVCSSRLPEFAVASDVALGAEAAAALFFTNLFVTFSYGMVGWYLVETQVRRYIANRSWSLSGLSLAAVFPTCAATHLILALARGTDNATLPFDLLGVPASIYFLWVVRRLHANSFVDWNRRPLLGMAAAPNRSAPWRDDA